MSDGRAYTIQWLERVGRVTVEHKPVCSGARHSVSPSQRQSWFMNLCVLSEAVQDGNEMGKKL
jgi:hypothetical protein